MSIQGSPTTSAEIPDRNYLAEALRRAARMSPPDGPIREELLDDGRTGARVSRLQCSDGNSFVLKIIPRDRSFRQALGHEGEAVAWLTGTTRGLPESLANPTIDVALHNERDEWWMLMDDVSSGIVGRDGWSEERTRELFEAVAPMHAEHWGWDDGERPGMGDVAVTTGVFVEISRYVGTGRAAASWVEGAAEEFRVPRMLLPDFLSAAGSEEGDFYLELLGRWPEIAAALDGGPSTLMHGDLRRANISFQNDKVILFDWELSGRGPAAADLTWHWFMRYWAYPPDDRAVEQRLWLRDAYLQGLEEALGRSVDPMAFSEAWDLGWLRVFCQLGFLLADGLGDEGGEARKKLIHTAIDKAKGIADEYLP